MQIPWRIVAEGCLALVAVAVAASLWPAMGVARANRWNCCRPDVRQSELAAMPKRRSTSAPFLLIIVGLLFVFVLTGWMAWRDKSETFDEPLHFIGRVASDPLRRFSLRSGRPAPLAILRDAGNLRGQASSPDIGNCLGPNVKQSLGRGILF